MLVDKSIGFKKEKEKVFNNLYIYRALINALSAHIIHINLNMILYTHVHSPNKKNLHKELKYNDNSKGKTVGGRI